MKKALYFIGAKVRTKFTMQIVKLLYFSPMIGQSLSKHIERMFDPNNIRRAGNWKISTTWIEIVTTSGSKLKLRLDEHIDWITFLKGDWDSLCLIILQKLSKKLESEFFFIDVGANIGAVCIPIAQYWPVLAFEPQPDLCKRLKEHLTINYVEELTVEELAVTSQEMSEKYNGSLLLYSPNGNSGGASTNPSWNSSKDSRAYQIVSSSITLDQYFNGAGKSFPIGKILIKIDTEGHELYVLQGANKFIAEHRPLIIFEFRPDLLGSLRSLELNNHVSSMKRYQILRLKLDGDGVLIERDSELATLSSFERILVPDEYIKSFMKALEIV